MSAAGSSSSSSSSSPGGGSSGDGSTVCVTGASGFIGSHVVRELLEKGYLVHGTVRDASNTQKYGWLQKLAEGAGGRLRLFSADLMEPGSFDAALAGSEMVCHVAAVVVLHPKGDAQKEVVDPAVEGTRNVFESILKHKKAKRVVLTSSYYAVIDAWAPSGTEFDEGHWHKEMSLKNPYPMAKTLAEKHAWKVYEEQKERAAKGEDGGWSFDLVTINPSLVLGDMLHESHGAGTTNIVKAVAGRAFPAVPRFSWPMVHVRDVATAHVRALENKNARGRYLVSQDRSSTSMLDMSRTIKARYPKCCAASLTMPDWATWALSLVHPDLNYEFTVRNVGRVHYVKSEKAKRELGMEFKEPKAAILDTLDSFIKLGLLEPMD